MLLTLVAKLPSRLEGLRQHVSEFWTFQDEVCKDVQELGIRNSSVKYSLRLNIDHIFTTLQALEHLFEGCRGFWAGSQWFTMSTGNIFSGRAVLLQGIAKSSIVHA